MEAINMVDLDKAAVEPGLSVCRSAEYNSVELKISPKINGIMGCAFFLVYFLRDCKSLHQRIQQAKYGIKA